MGVIEHGQLAFAQENEEVQFDASVYGSDLVYRALWSSNKLKCVEAWWLPHAKAWQNPMQF